jgi:hypothetical protein
MGKDFLKKFVENTREYQDEANVEKQNAMYKTAYPRWTAYMLMKNSDQGKCGSLMTSLTTQFSMGTNQYPEEVLKAIDILTNHKNLIRENQRITITTQRTRIGTTTGPSRNRYRWHITDCHIKHCREHEFSIW